MRRGRPYFDETGQTAAVRACRLARVRVCVCPRVNPHCGVLVLGGSGRPPTCLAACCSRRPGCGILRLRRVGLWITSPSRQLLPASGVAATGDGARGPQLNLHPGRPGLRRCRHHGVWQRHDWRDRGQLRRRLPAPAHLGHAAAALAEPPLCPPGGQQPGAAAAAPGDRLPGSAQGGVRVGGPGGGWARGRHAPAAAACAAHRLPSPWLVAACATPCRPAARSSTRFLPYPSMPRPPPMPPRPPPPPHPVAPRS